MEFKEINGVNVFAPPSREALMKYAFDHKKILVAVNAEKILHATDQTRNIINRNLGYPDGIGAVWALNQKGIKDTVKIPGCELWLDIIKHYETTKTFYLIGGNEAVIQETVAKLKVEFPAINIVNYRNGYIKTDAEQADLINDIVRLQPDIVFVAMGSPKQELLMEQMQLKHQALYQGLGGSYDVYTGKVERAPKLWIKYNLEWAYRLVKQPTRINRQIHLLRFLYLLKTNKF